MSIGQVGYSEVCGEVQYICGVVQQRCGEVVNNWLVNLRLVITHAQLKR